MAIIKKDDQRMTERDRRDMLRPFLDSESGTKALQSYINPDRTMDRGGMYTLEILNNLIQSDYGTNDLYQRVPPEVFGGLSKGGRRNVQASLIARAEDCTDEAQPHAVQESGYTRLQEVIGNWAERDGSWDDYPESTLEKKGYKHIADEDGSESRIFTDKKDKVFKTMAGTHYSNMSLFLDKITIHNSIFPELPYHIKGFGLRDDATPYSVKDDFVLIVDQPFVEGRRPTRKEVEDKLTERSFSKTENGFFWVSKTDNTVLQDITKGIDEIDDDDAFFQQASPNCVFNDKYRQLFVYDCDCFLKHFPVDSLQQDRFGLNELQANSVSGAFNEQVWRKILGDQYDKFDKNMKSRIVKALRLNGAYPHLINGREIRLVNPLSETVNINGRDIKLYRGTVAVGHPNSFKKEKIWKIPALQFNEQSVSEIKRNISRLLPETMDINDFLYDSRFFGPGAESKKAPIDRAYYRDCISNLGYIPMPDSRMKLNPDFVVQVNPNNRNEVLISHKDCVAFMVWTHPGEIEDIGKMTPADKVRLSTGQPAEINGRQVVFNLDKGRIDDVYNGLRLRLTQKVGMEMIPLEKEKKTEKKPAKAPKMPKLKM